MAFTQISWLAAKAGVLVRAPAYMPDRTGPSIPINFENATSTAAAPVKASMIVITTRPPLRKALKKEGPAPMPTMYAKRAKPKYPTSLASISRSS